MHAWYTTFFELHRPPKGYSPLFPQLQDATSGPHYFYLIRLVVSCYGYLRY